MTQWTWGAESFLKKATKRRFVHLPMRWTRRIGDDEDSEAAS